MQQSLATLGRCTISPAFTAEQLLQDIEYAGQDEVESALRPCIIRDEYEICPRLSGTGSSKTLKQAYKRRELSHYERLLTLRELLLVNMRSHSPKLRNRASLVVCQGFVLDFSAFPEESEFGESVTSTMLWPIWELWGTGIDTSIRFAVTPRTLVDKGIWDERLFAHW